MGKPTPHCLWRLLQGPNAAVLFLLLAFTGFLRADSGEDQWLVVETADGPLRICLTCENATNGGLIQGDEAGCPNPVFDPAPITNVQLPTGGTGVLEYVWIYTTDDPSLPGAQWEHIPNSNAPEYDPGPITQTTWYRRCARRSGCVDYVAESNIVVKEVSCCSNVTDGGQIGHDQTGCGVPFDPAPFVNVSSPSGGLGDIEYVWYASVTGTPFVPGNPDWVALPGSDTAALDMGPLLQTTWFVRLSRRAGCNLYAGQSNVIAVEVLPGFDLSATVDSLPTCVADSTALITLSIAGGSPPFAVSWSTGDTALAVSHLPAGQYAVTVTDSLGCVETLNVEVPVPDPIVVSFDIQHESCPGAADGMIAVSASGGTPPYVVEWDNGATGDTLHALLPGSYCVSVRDSNGCVTSACAEVLPAVPMGALLSSVPASCAAVADGQASVDTVWGGTAPYTYAWSDPLAQNAPQATGLQAGTYFLTIADANGCTYVDSVEVDALNPMTVFASATPASCLGANDGAAEVYEVQGGTPPYTYQWSDPLAQNTPQATALPPGMYTVTVTDASGCSQTAQVIVPAALVFEIHSALSAPSCGGLADGAIQIDSVTGGVAPYAFAWSTGDTGTALVALPAGEYGLTVTDAQGCQTIQYFILTDPEPMQLEMTAVGPACAGATTGFAAVSVVSGGVPPFTYQWDDPSGQTTATAFGLAAGTYTVTVIDANGCMATASAVLPDGVALATEVSTTGNYCGSEQNGTATVVVFNGEAPYSYQWSDPLGQTSATATSLASGTYTVTVIDANGCQAVDTAVVGAEVDIQLLVTAADLSCAGANDGMASVTILSGNAASLLVEWNVAGSLGQYALSGLAAGTYSVTVTDTVLNCSATGQAIVGEPDTLVLSLAATPESCAGAADGTAMAAAAGGTPPYQFFWSTGDTVSQIGPLAPGTYQVSVQDANGCTATDAVLVGAGPALEIDFSVAPASCPDAADGAATAVVTGGTAPYSYEWNDPSAQSAAQAVGLSPGTWQLTVTDAQGCSQVATVTVGSASDLAATLEAVPASCNGASDGQLIVHAIGGGGNYSYAWDGVAATDSVASGLSAGLYSVTVSAADGCSLALAGEVGEPLPLVLDVLGQDVSCPGQADGMAMAFADGGTPPYQYQWDDPSNQTTQAATNLPEGQWSVTVTDANGCTAVAAVQIGLSSDLALSVQAQPALCAGSATGTATAVATGGQPPYAYQWSSGHTTAQADGLAAGWYVVSVTDLAGCTLTDSVEVAAPTVMSCEASVLQPVSGYGLSDGAVAVSVSGGTPPYTYAWDTGDTTAQVYGLPAGIYEVTATDAHGCTCLHAIALDNPSRLGDRVWLDANENGIQDAGETGVHGVMVVLAGQAATGQPVADTVVTDSAGTYWFDGLPAGTYELAFFPPSQYALTARHQGNDAALDSDPDPATGMTGQIDLLAATSRDDIDAGLVLLDEPMNLGDRVWHDFNRNGIQDAGEQGLANVRIELRSWPAMALLQTALTDANGIYGFSNVMPGQYVLVVDQNTLPQGFVLTQPNVGDDAYDSDFDPVSGQTAVIAVAPYQPDDMSIDAGAHAECVNVTSGGTIAGDEELCGAGADPSPIVSLEPASGGVGEIEYLWLIGTAPQFNGAGDPNWTPIPNSNAPDYDPGPIPATRWFIRCARRAGCSEFVAESNIVAKVVIDLPLTQIQQAPDSLCVDETAVLVAANAGGGAEYFWDFGPQAVPPSASLRVVPAVYWQAAGTHAVQLVVTRFGCADTATAQVYVQQCSSPLVIFDFEAALQDDYTLLSWYTEGDDADTWFQIDYSRDGQHWEAIELMEGDAGPGVHAYSYVHTTPVLGENWYRVRHFRASGAQFTTQPLMVEKVLQPSFAGFRLFPNPVSGELHLYFDHSLEEDTRVWIATPVGQMLQEVVVAAGSRRLQLEVDALPAGTYALHVAYPYRRPVAVLFVKQ